MGYCGACGYLMYDCVCERVEPHQLACFCCGLDLEDEPCDNDGCDLYGLEPA